MNKHIIEIGAVVLLICVGLSGCVSYNVTNNGLPITGESIISITDYDITVDYVEIDKLYLDEVEVSLTNEGSASSRIDQIVITTGDSNIEMTLFLQTVKPNEQLTIIGNPYSALDRNIGDKQIEGTVSLVQYSGEILAEKNITIQIPFIKSGDIIPEIGRDENNLSFTLISCKERDKALYSTGSYNILYLSREGYKFIIATYELKNNWIREQSTPYLYHGEVATDKGYIYSKWDWTDNYDEYETRTATDDEKNELIGDSGGYEKLLPEESVKGCIVFEISEDETALEISINEVPSIINLD